MSRSCTTTAPPSAPATASGFKPESEVPDDAHAYRAHIFLGKPSAAAAKNGLITANFDPAGPIDPNRISDPDLKAEYLARINPPAAGPGGLPPLAALGGSGRRGTRKGAAA